MSAGGKSFDKIIITEYESPINGKTCTFNFYFSDHHRHTVAYYIKNQNITRVQDHLETSVDNFLNDLYFFCKKFNYSYDNILIIENQLPKDSFWNKLVPKEDVYIFSKNETELIIYVESPYGESEDEQEDLNDNCETYYGIFFDKPKDMGRHFLCMQIHSERMLSQSYILLNDNLLGSLNGLSTPKNFVNLFLLYCFQHSIADGTEFIFHDNLDIDSPFRKLLPKKVKFDLKNGKINILDPLL